MKKLILSLLFVALSTSFVNAQTIQHLSVDISNPLSFYTSQKNTNWCWAACNQMLLNAIGIPETQENQVKKLFGALINEGAGENYESAERALNGTYKDSFGNIIKISPYVSYLRDRHNNDPIIIINQLKKGIPLVMATTQHGRVCVGVDYDTDGISYQITQIRLLNPLKPNSIETISMQAFINNGLMGFMTYKAN